MPIDYTIRIPVNVSGQEGLTQIDTVLARIGGDSPKATAGELRASRSRYLKADAAAGLSLSASLKDVTAASTFQPSNSTGRKCDLTASSCSSGNLRRSAYSSGRHPIEDR